MLPGHDFDSNLKIVGSGEHKEYCGKVKKVGACEEREVESYVEHHLYCDDRLCPKCHYSWSYRQASRMKERLRAYEKIFDEIPELRQRNLSGEDMDSFPYRMNIGKIHHWTFSPDQEWSKKRIQTVRGVKNLRTELYKVLKISGMIGASVVFHPWRTTDRAKDEWDEVKFSKEKFTNKGIWEWLKKTGLIYQPGYVYLSPHFHVVGFGFLKKSNEVYDLTKGRNREGWVYVKIRSIGDDKDLMGCLKYILNHSSVVGNPKTGFKSNGAKYVKFPMETVTYWGDLSYRKLRNEKVSKEMEIIECPKCENIVYEWRGWNQKEGYDKNLDRIVWLWSWNEKEGIDQPRCMKGSHEAEMVYYVETWRYWLKEYPDNSVRMVRGNNPLGTKEKHEFNFRDDHDSHAYDHVSGKWFDNSGNLVS